MTATGDGACTIRIRGLPVAIWAKAQDSSDDLIREFTLIALGDVPGERELPQRLMALLQQLTESYGHIGAAQTELLQRAAIEGVETLDELVYDIPPSAAAATTELGRMLDECDEYCKTGEHLLTLAAEADVRAFRWWFLDEIRAQVEGAPPTPWAESSWALRAHRREQGGD
jgi:hypothetical protein